MTNPLKPIFPILDLLGREVKILPATGGAVEDLQYPDQEEIEDIYMPVPSEKVVRFADVEGIQIALGIDTMEVRNRIPAGLIIMSNGVATVAYILQEEEMVADPIVLQNQIFMRSMHMTLSQLLTNSIYYLPRYRMPILP